MIKGLLRPNNTMYYSFVLIIFSETFLQRIGLNLSSYPIDFGIIIEYIASIYFLWNRKWVFNTTRVIIYITVIIISAFSYTVNLEYSSINSFYLLVVIYSPFSFVVGKTARAAFSWSRIVSLYSNILFLIAISGILQFVVQFVFSPDWLFDFTPYLPEIIQNNFGYNTTIPVGQFYKSNGFFLKEPSGFSQLMAFGIILEGFVLRRPVFVAVMTLGLLVSYSGTGILVVVVGILFSVQKRTVLPLLLSCTFAALIYVALGDPLNLSFTISRVAEFSDDASSGYQRFIAPVRLVVDLFGSKPWSPFIGHGPGTVLRIVTGYVFFDPSWARLLIEYGILGTLVFCALLYHAVWRSPAPVGFRVAVITSWLFTGENLLSSQTNAVIFVLFSLWPSDGESAARSPQNSRGRDLVRTKCSGPSIGNQTLDGPGK